VSGKLPKGWQRREDSYVAYFWAEVFELVVKGDCAFMRANGNAYAIGEGYKTEAEAIEAATQYGRELVQRLQELLQ
jgi:hypothetical protein